MSSIYDALKRIQREGDSRLFPPSGSGVSSRKTARRALILAAVVFILCIAGVSAVVLFIGKGDHDPQDRSALAGDRGATEGKSIPAGLPGSRKTDASESGGTPDAGSHPRSEPAVLDDMDDYLMRGTQHYTAREYDKALAVYMQAIQIFRRDARLLNNIGIVMLAKGQPDRAVSYFRQAASLSGGSAEPVYNLACAYALLGDRDQAVSNLKTACTLNPEARDWAARDPDLLALKGVREFDEIVGAQ